MIDLYWAFGVVERSRELFFDYLKALKIEFILCILVLIVVCLGFYLDFWGLALWDLMIYWFLAGIFDNMWFDVLIGELLGFVRMVVAKILGGFWGDLVESSLNFLVVSRVELL